MDQRYFSNLEMFDCCNVAISEEKAEISKCALFCVDNTSGQLCAFLRTARHWP